MYPEKLGLIITGSSGLYEVLWVIATQKRRLRIHKEKKLRMYFTIPK
jgi:hypothetical protein